MAKSFLGIRKSKTVSSVQPERENDTPTGNLFSRKATPHSQHMVLYACQLMEAGCLGNVLLSNKCLCLGGASFVSIHHTFFKDVSISHPTMKSTMRTWTLLYFDSL